MELTNEDIEKINNALYEIRDKLYDLEYYADHDYILPMDTRYFVDSMCNCVKYLQINFGEI